MRASQASSQRISASVRKIRASSRIRNATSRSGSAWALRRVYAWSCSIEARRWRCSSAVTSTSPAATASRTLIVSSSRAGASATTGLSNHLASCARPGLA